MATDPKLTEQLALLEELKRRQTYDKLSAYTPYPKQRDFHALGKTCSEYALIASTQSGKSYAASMEVAMHATQRYPTDWPGRRFKGAVRIWCLGLTGESTRDVPQLLLHGPIDQPGTGALPQDSIQSVRLARGVPNALDSILVKCANGGLSEIIFKSQEKGRERLQGATLDFVWQDEEGPFENHIELISRVAARSGAVICTFTPLLGFSSVVKRFMSEPSPDRGWINMTIDDALHYTAESRARTIAAWPEHERETRAQGRPSMGAGRIFTAVESELAIEPFPIPAYWTQICGIDFGFRHNFAAAWLAWDRDADVIYLRDAYVQSGATPILHAAAIKTRGAVPIAWPHDGLATEKGSGESLMSIYKAQGLPMLPAHASDLSGGNSVEASLADLIDRMQTRRFRVFKHLEPFWREYRLYRRAPDGKILKEDDDCISVVRYASMSLRHARPVGEVGQRRNRGPQQATGLDYDRFNRDADDGSDGARPGHYSEREIKRRAQAFKYG